MNNIPFESSNGESSSFVSLLSSEVQPKKHCTLLSIVQNANVTEAEIQTALTHSSLGSCNGLSKLFARMFGDSMIA